MRLDDIEESSNVEDQRGASPGGMAVGGGIGTIVLALIVMALGGNPSQILSTSSAPPSSMSRRSAPPSSNDEGKIFVSKVLKETEVVWTEIFKQYGKNYTKPKLILFTGQVRSACGLADTAVGPFYCPGDAQVYIDLDFYQVLKDKLGAGGDFARAYVVAHEVGHHVQDLLGTSAKVDQLRRRLSDKDFNKVSVRMELQADFYAGVWANHAKELRLTDQDIEDGLNAAHSVGDDTLQREMRGTVVPDSFTHGTSEQRMRWFKKGYDTGDINQGDTFSATEL